LRSRLESSRTRSRAPWCTSACPGRTQWPRRQVRGRSTKRARAFGRLSSKVEMRYTPQTRSLAMRYTREPTCPALKSGNPGAWSPVNGALVPSSVPTCSRLSARSERPTCLRGRPDATLDWRSGARGRWRVPPRFRELRVRSAHMRDRPANYFSSEPCVNGSARVHTERPKRGARSRKKVPQTTLHTREPCAAGGGRARCKCAMSSHSPRCLSLSP
jgi:hypothetical protein